jgi:soluble lytic murein transglycosylase-like protein
LEEAASHKQKLTTGEVVMKLLIMALLTFPAFGNEKEAIIELIKISASNAGVDQATALAIVEQESHFHPEAIRKEPKFKTYSVGLFQMFVPTARAMGFKGTVKQLQEPVANIKLGIKHLQQCTARFGNNPKLVACCHNAGTNVKVSFCKNYAWTARYVKEVLEKRAKYQTPLASL